MKKSSKRSQSHTLVKLVLTLLSLPVLRLRSKSHSHKPYNKGKNYIFLYIHVFTETPLKKCDFVTLLVTTMIIKSYNSQIVFDFGLTLCRINNLLNSY